MTVKEIGNVATFVSGVFTRPYTLRNAGANDVYLGQDSSLTVHSRALTLTRGATVQWDGSTELWAVCAAGETSELEWVYEAASSVTDGTQYTEITGDVNLAPGSTVGIDGTVTVDGSVNIAGGTIGISGPVTVDGDVNVDGSTINVGTPIQNKNISDLTTIATGTRVISGAGAPLITFTPSGVYDVSEFTSVLIDTYLDGIGAWNDTITNYFSVVVEFYRLSTDPAANVAPVQVLYPQFTLGDSVVSLTKRPRCSVQIPVAARYMVVRIFCTVGTFYGAANARATIYGSNEMVPSVRYNNVVGDTWNSLQTSGIVQHRSAVLNYDQTVLIGSTDEDMYVETFRAASASSPTFVVYGVYNGNLIDIWNQTLAAGGSNNQHTWFSPVKVPIVPIATRLRILTAAGDTYITLTQMK